MAAEGQAPLGYQVVALQHQASPHAVRRLQEAFGTVVTDLSLPGRFTSFAEEAQFQRQILRYIARAYFWLRLIRRAVRRVYPYQTITFVEVDENVLRFDDWIQVLIPYTNLQGLRTLQHHPRCRSRRCLIYGCTFRPAHDEASVLIYPEYLFVERDVNNRITRITHCDWDYDLE